MIKKPETKVDINLDVHLTLVWESYNSTALIIFSVRFSRPKRCHHLVGTFDAATAFSLWLFLLMQLPPQRRAVITDDFACDSDACFQLGFSFGKRASNIHDNRNRYFGMKADTRFCKPSVLIERSMITWFRVMLKPASVTASAISRDVTDPNNCPISDAARTILTEGPAF